MMHTRAGYALALVLALVLAAGCAPASAPGSGAAPGVHAAVPDGLTVDVRQSFYPVRGDTPRELNGALALAAPRHRGRRAYGLTDWTLRWSYDALPDTRACRVADPEFRLTITTRLPRWEDRERAPARVVADWDLFMTRLRDHETGHRERVIREAIRVLEALREASASTCESLRASVRDAVLRAEDRMWEVNRHYDRSTDYGRAQAPGRVSGR